MADNIELHVTEPSNAPFGKGMQVEYLSKGAWVPAEIIDVHHDDTPPYYTIYIPPHTAGCGAKMCGCSCMCICNRIREKQTVRHKLRLGPRVTRQAPIATDDGSLTAPNPTPVIGPNSSPSPSPPPNLTQSPATPAVHHHHIQNFYPQTDNGKRMSMVFR